MQKSSSLRLNIKDGHTYIRSADRSAPSGYMPYFGHLNRTNNKKKK